MISNTKKEFIKIFPEFSNMKKCYKFLKKCPIEVKYYLTHKDICFLILFHKNSDETLNLLEYVNSSNNKFLIYYENESNILLKYPNLTNLKYVILNLKHINENFIYKMLIRNYTI